MKKYIYIITVRISTIVIAREQSDRGNPENDNLLNYLIVQINPFGIYVLN